ncbi:MAG: nitrogen fixation protein NifX [Zetaproteobacteria bacterium CG_4_9_14_3_um_filter_49_83]|nr:MAG: nitrogen fixation protein NifX [Zetaproteobacteria bacterium CG1_02_49_23]PIQ30993.1 MAG: nitrogen fixation protein NifX [Zetaproteobacteria bacterium CG17_big_fil_post_rev_8_21_14_2_50_50_13]PIY56877.1 MAG: nitrogen fixation protein NifX [Zetaproteobacteria bacterium CG_4_10_14_0_8_um_filter_49_80]PJA35867.1 MAG: nitrogen fixation protein NifX [Zetaproteobacteria bacterium CG_4_9_14_3_um_filter_49_83]
MQLQRQLRVVDPVADIEASLKVAFATTDMKQVNQHFGSAKSFAIYAINAEQATLLEVAQFGRLDQDGNEDKLTVKLEALKGCGIVYSQAVGSSAVQQLMRLNIQPVRVEAGSRIADLIKSLQEDLVQGPSAWVAKALASHRKESSDRFDTMEDEGWSE